MIANAITASRILFSFALLFLSPFSTAFVVLYFLCGVSDGIDGFIARKLHTQSRTGEILDSLADLVFLGVAAYQRLPSLRLPSWLWMWAAGITLLKVGGVVLGSFLRKTLYMPHTIANKVTGGLLFFWGLSIGYFDPVIPTALVCLSASFSSVEEIVRLFSPAKA